MVEQNVNSQTSGDRIVEIIKDQFSADLLPVLRLFVNKAASDCSAIGIIENEGLIAELKRWKIYLLWSEPVDYTSRRQNRKMSAIDEAHAEFAAAHREVADSYLYFSDTILCGGVEGFCEAVKRKAERESGNVLIAASI